MALKLLGYFDRKYVSTMRTVFVVYTAHIHVIVCICHVVGIVHARMWQVCFRVTT